MKQYFSQPKKSLGQHFLRNPRVLDKIVEVAQVGVNDLVVEVGPGEGVLTERLLARGGQILAVEIDALLAAALQERFKSNANFQLVHADALQFTPPATPYKLVANIPYYITSPLFAHFLQAANPPTKIVVLIQREVAEKIVAGGSVLAEEIKFWGSPKLVLKVGRHDFSPPPRVESAVLVVDVVSRAADFLSFQQVLHQLYTAPRQKISNTLKTLFASESELKKSLMAAGLSGEERVAVVKTEQLISLAETLSQNAESRGPGASAKSSSRY